MGAVNAVDNPTRQSFVIEMVGPDRVVNAVSLNSVIVQSARIVGPAIAGILIAGFGVVPCFVLNALTFVAMIVALWGMDPSACTPPPVAAARAGRDPRRAALRHRHSGAGGAAGADGARRHARLQLPGGAPAARQVQLRRRRRPPTRCWSRDGRRLDRRRPGQRRPRPHRPAPDRRRRPRLRHLRPARRGDARRCARDPDAGPARRRRGHLRRDDQLHPAARRRAGDARPGDGALFGRLPRLDPDRRAADRLALPGLRPPRGPAPGRGLGPLGGLGGAGLLRPDKRAARADGRGGPPARSASALPTV